MQKGTRRNEVVGRKRTRNLHSNGLSHTGDIGITNQRSIILVQMERLSFKSYFKQYGKRIANNTLLFVLAYLLVFYAVQAVTVFGAFTHGVSVKIYTSCIDFDSL